MTVHDGRGGGDSQRVSGLNHFDPLAGGDPSRCDAVSHFLDQYLSGSPGQTPDASTFQLRQVFAKAHS